MKDAFDSMTEAQRKRIEVAFDCIRPLVLPGDWRLFEDYVNAGWWLSRSGLLVCMEVESHGDAGLWIHVSTSRQDRVPSYDDLKLVKVLFIGTHRKAIQVFAPESEHYNLHQFCLHLWSPVDRDPLPDLRTAGGAL